MPVAEQSKVFINFTGGLNTEATALNFPENAATDLDNFDLFRTGEVKRRLGLEFENNYVLRPSTFAENDYTTFGVSSHEWLAVNGKGELNFLVVQVGLELFFHDLGSEPVSGTERGSVDLSPFQTGPNARTCVIDTSFGEGRMIVANRELEPVYVEFNEAAGTFAIIKIDMRIRDFDGVDDGLDTGQRPINLSPAHEYNLRNQGWPNEIAAANRADGDNGVSLRDPVSFVFQELGEYPSSADIIHLAKLGAVDKPESLGAFHPDELNKLQFGNSPAPKGHFILDPFNRDRAGVAGIGGLPVGQVDTLRPSSTEFYAGRVWFAGVPTEQNSGDVFFSQQLTDMSVAGNCYQEQDPTAEDFNDLLATDGGVIHIADMGRVQTMVVIGQDLVLVASNGLWAVSGASGGNFNATDFTVRKVSDIGTLAPESVLEVEGALYYWNEGGIYSVSSGQISDQLDVERISRDTIQGFYDDIREAGRAYARGFYDDFNKKLYWFYNDTPGYDAINFRFDYNRALAFDLTTNSFYPYSFGTLSGSITPMIAAMTQKTPGTEDIVQFDVVQAGDDVVDGVDDVCQSIAFPTYADAKLKLLTFVRDIVDPTLFRYTFSEFNSRDFVDWKVWDIENNGALSTGADYDSVIQTGFTHSGDPLPLKHLTHVVSYFNRTEDGYELDSNNEIVLSNPSGAQVQVRWEWTDLDVGRWTKQESAYRLLRVYIPNDVNDPFDYGETVIKTKLRMRGKGHAFSIRYESESGKDMQLLGFGINMRAGTKL